MLFFPGGGGCRTSPNIKRGNVRTGWQAQKRPPPHEEKIAKRPPLGENGPHTEKREQKGPHIAKKNFIFYGGGGVKAYTF